MNATLAWNNLVSYSLQIGLLVGIAAVVPTLLRMRLPKARLTYWYALLAACLILPQIRPWQQELITISTPARVAPPPAQQTTQTPVPPAERWKTGELALAVLAAGACCRLGWLVVGFWRLRRYRKHSTLWRAEVTTFGPRPEYRISDEVGSPVTFGVRQPVVLLPRTFLNLTPAQQHAVLCHETVHVERRDWAFTIAEEVVRAVFWFHPAIWWLLAEIQLAREQAVDREVVERTQARDEYVDTLLAVAGARLENDLALAPLFLRKRHLRQRVLTIIKEHGMSRIRTITTLAAGLVLLAGVGWFVGAAFPLMAAPQVVQDAAGVTVDVGGAQLMHRGTISYPGDAAKSNVQGTVAVQIRLGSDGSVVDAVVQSGPDELRRAVLQSVLGWHFHKSLAGTTRQVTVKFELSPDMVAANAANRPGSAVTISSNVPGGARQTTSVLHSIQVFGLPDQAKSELLASLPVHEGETMNSPNESMRKIQDAVMAYDEHLAVSWRITKEGEQDLVIIAPTTAAAIAAAHSSVNVTPSTSGSLAVRTGDSTQRGATPSSAPTQPRRLTIGANVMAAQLIYGPKPTYPPLAKAARVTGVVQLHAFISTDGSIQSLTVIPPAHPLLAPAALEAVRQWRYKPVMLNDQAVEVETTIDVTFLLAQDQQ